MHSLCNQFYSSPILLITRRIPPCSPLFPLLPSSSVCPTLDLWSAWFNAGTVAPSSSWFFPGSFLRRLNCSAWFCCYQSSRSSIYLPCLCFWDTYSWNSGDSKVMKIFVSIVKDFKERTLFQLLELTDHKVWPQHIL